MTPELEAAWRAEFEREYKRDYPNADFSIVHDGLYKKRDSRLVWGGYFAAKRADAAEIARLRSAISCSHEEEIMP